MSQALCNDDFLDYFTDSVVITKYCNLKVLQFYNCWLEQITSLQQTRVQTFLSTFSVNKKLLRSHRVQLFSCCFPAQHGFQLDS